MSNEQICINMYKKGFRLSLESGKHNGTFFYTEKQREESENKNISIARINGVEFVPGAFLDSEFEYIKNHPSLAQ